MNVKYSVCMGFIICCFIQHNKHYDCPIYILYYFLYIIGSDLDRYFGSNCELHTKILSASHAQKGASKSEFVTVSDQPVDGELPVLLNYSPVIP